MVGVAPVEHGIGDVPVDVVDESARIFDEGPPMDLVDGQLQHQHHEEGPRAEEQADGRIHGAVEERCN